MLGLVAVEGRPQEDIIDYFAGPSVRAAFGECQAARKDVLIVMLSEREAIVLREALVLPHGTLWEDERRLSIQQADQKSSSA